MRYIIELEDGVWIADVSGDPGRTLLIKNAKEFSGIIAAKSALKHARQYRPFKHAQISPISRKE
jgi:hypothetical protein